MDFQNQPADVTRQDEMRDQTRIMLARQLHDFIEAEAEVLLQSIRVYVVQAHLANGWSVGPVAHELLNEMVVEALAHVERFADVRNPHAWLLGIAANLVRRKQIIQIKRRRREPLALDLDNRDLSEEQIFDRLRAVANSKDPARQVEARDTIAYLLSPLTPDERYLIRLAVILDLSRKDIADELDITPGAVRVRLHRALRRLRAIWEGEYDG